MRAAEIIQRRDAAARRAIAQALRLETSDPAALTAQMRGDGIETTMRRMCKSAIMIEDLALLCANPVDPVASDEMARPDVFEQAGFVEAVDETMFEVNLDVALTLIASMPIEFGLTMTLLGRLSSAELSQVARAVEIGPRPSQIDLIVDVAAALGDKRKLMTQVAHLRASDRAVIEEALALGDLPERTTPADARLGPPKVTLEPGEAGARGLVYRFEHAERNIASRPVVPVELREQLAEALRTVPPPPEVVARKAPAPREKRVAPTPRVKSPSESTSPRSRQSAASAPLVGLLPSLDARRTEARAGVVEAPAPIPRRPVQVIPISGFVELESQKAVDQAFRDAELGEAIVDVVGEATVLIRPGVDPHEWAERYALRYGF